MIKIVWVGVSTGSIKKEMRERERERQRVCVCVCGSVEAGAVCTFLLCWAMKGRTT